MTVSSANIAVAKIALTAMQITLIVLILIRFQRSNYRS